MIYLAYIIQPKRSDHQWIPKREKSSFQKGFHHLNVLNLNIMVEHTMISKFKKNQSINSTKKNSIDLLTGLAFSPNPSSGRIPRINNSPIKKKEKKIEYFTHMIILWIIRLNRIV